MSPLVKRYFLLLLELESIQNTVFKIGSVQITYFCKQNVTGNSPTKEQQLNHEITQGNQPGPS